MAARRGKTQAKRNSGGDSGLPGWAWMVLGILLAVVAILVAPKYLKSGGDGAVVVGAGEAVAVSTGLGRAGVVAGAGSVLAVAAAGSGFC